jgi:hypothetical protein
MWCIAYNLLQFLSFVKSWWVMMIHISGSCFRVGDCSIQKDQISRVKGRWCPAQKVDGVLRQALGGFKAHLLHLLGSIYIISM